MSNSPSESLYCDLNLIHKVITRGIGVSLENAEKYRASGFPNERTKRGFKDYVRNLVITLENHHHSEDAIAFPVYQRYAPEAPFELLATEHHNMLTILERVEKALGLLEDPSRESEGLNALHNALGDLSQLWSPHINCEEGHFCARSLLTSIPDIEKVEIGKKISTHAAQNSGPLPLSLSFLLYNLPPDERAAFSHGIPKLVTRFLLPVIWRRRWTPMKPFLLDQTP